VRAERAVIDKLEERLKGRLAPLDGTALLNEVERAPKRQMRQAKVQERTQLTQYALCRLVEPAGAGWTDAAPALPKGRAQQRALSHRQGTGAAAQHVADLRRHH
jgi:hypothetical protein